MGIWTKLGSGNLAQIYLGNQSQNAKLYLGLFLNDIDTSLLNDALLTDLEEPTAVAYHRAEMLPSNWIVTNELTVYPTIDFQVSVAAYGLIYGCFIASSPDNSGVLLAIHKYTVPVSLQYYGDILAVNVRISIT